MNPAVKIIASLAPARWQEYRTLRLQALKTAPSSFARTHKEDTLLVDKVWKDHLIAAQTGKKSMMVFAQSGPTLIGMVGAIIDHGEMVNHRATIISMYVDPAHRGQGISKKMLQLILDNLISSSIIHIKLTVNARNQEAITLYESLGFKKIGLLEKALHVGNEFHDEWLMVKLVTQ